VNSRKKYAWFSAAISSSKGTGPLLHKAPH
jgi:hypothetical protein